MNTEGSKWHVVACYFFFYVAYFTVFLSLWYNFQIRIEILKTPCSIFRSLCHLCTSKKQFLISLNKLQTVAYIHANDYVQFSVSYIICCYVDQNVLFWSLLNSLTRPQHLILCSWRKSLHAKWLNKLSQYFSIHFH